MPPPIAGTVPPPLPPTGDERFAPPGMAPPIVPPVEPVPNIEPGPPTPVGQEMAQYVAADNQRVQQEANQHSQNLQAANAPKTAMAIQQVAAESKTGATVTAAEYLAQAKQQEAERTAEAQAETVKAEAEVAKAAEKAAPVEAPAATPPAQGVSVPVMITRQMEADLLATGFTQEQINRMTPAQANEHLERFQIRAAPVEALTPAAASAPAAAPPTEQAAAPAEAVVVGGQVFTGATPAEAMQAAHAAVGPDAITSAETGWVDPETGRFVSREIYDAYHGLNTAIEAAGGNMEHPAVAEAGARLEVAQARDTELNNQIVQPSGEQVVDSGVKGQEALVSVRPSQELAVPLAGVTVSVEGVTPEGARTTAQRPAAQALNDARNDRTAFTLLLDCLH